MQQLMRRIALLEALSQPREGRRCLIVHRYHGETTADALQAEGSDGAVPGALVLVFRRDFRSRDAVQGAQQ